MEGNRIPMELHLKILGIGDCNVRPTSRGIPRIMIS